MGELIKNKKGFTLLELLVVVLIIGILASIALPQYQMAVGKAKLSTLKEFTRSLGEARERYLLANSSYPKSVNDLDIDITLSGSSQSTDNWFQFSTPQDITCQVWSFDFNKAASCGKNIFGKRVNFSIKGKDNSPNSCIVYSEDKEDRANQLCSKETGTRLAANCADDDRGQYCVYYY